MTHFYDKITKGKWIEVIGRCQCPLELMTHFYGRWPANIATVYYKCQCPLELMTHFYVWNGVLPRTLMMGVNALSS